MIHPEYRLNCALLTLIWTGLLLTGCPAEPDVPPTLSDAVALTRTHRVSYTPGSTFDVTLTIEVREDVDISAIALIETTPSGWVYTGASSPQGGLPALRPQNGTEGDLNFVWIQPPSFPYTFTYSLGIPLNASGVATLQGHAEFRQGDGAAETTDILTSSAQEL